MDPLPPIATVSLDVDTGKEGEKKTEEDKYAKFPTIGVEPAMFLFMMGYRMVYVVEEAFFLYKACTVDLAFPLHVCQHITQQAYKNYSAEVQIKVSSFHQYNNAGLLAIPAVLIIFLGAWSDTVGRKAPLLLGLIGYFIHALMTAIISINDKWNLESILYAATIPGSLTGRDWTIYMACFSYLSDTTSPEKRTIRSTLLAVAYLMPIPLGVTLDETKIAQLYTFWKFNWNVKIYSMFKAFEGTSYITGLLICAPLVQKYFKLQDAIILIFGGSSFLLSRIFYVLSQTPIWFYVGAGCCFIGPIISPVGRSIVSKVVHISDRGKMFALVGIFQLTARFLASIAYSQVYIHTIKTTFPEAFFFVTILCKITIILIGLYIHFSILDRKNVGEEREENLKQASKEMLQTSSIP